jgi:hypothetical protein
MPCSPLTRTAAALWAPALLAGLLTAAAGTPARADPEVAARPTTAATAAEADRAYLAALLGKPVLGDGGEVLGRVDDIALDPMGGRARQMVLALDDGRRVAVDFARVRYHAGRDELRLAGVGRSDLASLPDYARGDPAVSLSHGSQPRRGR